MKKLPVIKALFVSLAFGASGYVDLGTQAPPATLGPYTVQLFDITQQSAIPDYASVTVIPGDPRGGSLTSSINLVKRTVPTSWSTWSHGYTGPVFSSNASTTVTLTLNPPANAFLLYVEPDNFGFHNCTVTTNTGLTSGPVPINGIAGARGFGFWDDTNPITSVTVSCAASSAGFAVAEFGVNTAIISPQPKIELFVLTTEFTKDGYIDFDKSPVGTQKGPAIIRIENQGGQTVFISGVGIREFTYSATKSLNMSNTQSFSLSSTQSNFILDLNAGERPCRTTQFNLGPGNFCTLGVIFFPQAEGKKEAHLNVFVNQPYPAASLYMTGTGISQPSQPPTGGGSGGGSGSGTGGGSGGGSDTGSSTGSGGGGGCSMSAGVSPINALLWFLIPAFAVARRIRRVF